MSLRNEAKAMTLGVSSLARTVGSTVEVGQGCDGQGHRELHLCIGGGGECQCMALLCLAGVPCLAGVHVLESLATKEESVGMH